ncbi:MAG TPA: 50S ribosomal protein L3, partial [Thermoanaerobaculia bacterium]|nr:50S ribosomal protein L3 [Thermoanaerobaculia bacterium]
HGSMFHRAPGSIGPSAFPSRVYPGTRSSGRLGGRQATAKNLTVVRVDADNNLLYLKGAVPGARNSIVKIVRSSFAVGAALRKPS